LKAPQIGGRMNGWKMGVNYGNGSLAISQVGA
jgi:hypothetical protein